MRSNKNKHSGGVSCSACNAFILLCELKSLILHEMLLKCIDSGYLLDAALLTVLIVWKLCRCFVHGMKMCIWFWYNNLIIFSHFFWFVNLVSFFLQEMLSKCMDSGYLMGATPLTVFLQLFWNFADVFWMEWTCACGFGAILWYYFSLSLQFSGTNLSFSSAL